MSIITMYDNEEDDFLFLEQEVAWDLSDLDNQVGEVKTVADPNEICGILDLALFVSRDNEVPFTPIPKLSKVIGLEVGDDRVDLSSLSAILCIMLSIQSRVLQMRTSEDDTCVNKNVWNFCEVTNGIPSSITNSFDYARRTGNFQDMDFTDAPQLRIIMDAQKGDRSHSSTVTGKASMLGSRTNACRTEHWESLQIAQLMQDGLLRTARSNDPKYLPDILGGCNVKPLFGSDYNTFLYMKAFRGGGYDRVYGTAVSEIKHTLYRMERGEYSSPVLCKKLRDRQEYLHATYGSQVFVPSDHFKSRFDPDDPGAPLYEATTGQNQFSSVENRLLATKTLIGRRGARIEYAKAKRLQEQLFGTLSFKGLKERDRNQRLLAREEFGGALQANTAFKNLVDRKGRGNEGSALMRAGFLTVNNAVTEFRLSDAVWLGLGGKTETFSIKDISFSEDMFLRKEVSLEESMKVSGIPLRTMYTKTKLCTRSTVSKVGLWQINGTMQEWATRLEERLLYLWNVNERRPLRDNLILEVFDEDREWVNDDTTLIAKCCVDSARLNISGYAALISDDRRLGNQMAKTANLVVIRLSAKTLVNQGRLVGPFSSDMKLHVGQFCHWVDIPPREQKAMVSVYIDTGSLASACANLHEQEECGVTYRYVKTPISSGVTDDGVRWSRYTLSRVLKENVHRTERHFPAVRDSARIFNRKSAWESRSPARQSSSVTSKDSV